MGEPMDRSHRVFGQLSTFERVFPTLETAKVEYTEFEYSAHHGQQRWHDLKRQGGLIRCSNERCFRGGYEIDYEVQTMVKDGTMEKTVELRCRGDEGTPKKHRGRSCSRSIKATIKLELKPTKPNP